MKIYLNDQITEFSGKTLQDLLDTQNFAVGANKNFAVALNLQLVKKQDYQMTLLSNNDTIDIVEIAEGG